MQCNSGHHLTPLFWYLGFHGNAILNFISTSKASTHYGEYYDDVPWSLMKEIKKNLNPPFFYFHGDCGKVSPTDSDFFGLSRSSRRGCDRKHYCKTLWSLQWISKKMHLGYQIFWLWTYLVSIPGTSHAHYIWYLSFYLNGGPIYIKLFLCSIGLFISNTILFQLLVPDIIILLIFSKFHTPWDL